MKTRRFPCICSLIQRLKDSPVAYRCPFCKRLHAPTIPTAKKESARG